MRRLTAALRRSPRTASLLDGDLLDVADVDPIHEAFAPMVRSLRYDVSELAVATLLQAVEAGVPIAALPVVLVGNFPHRSLYVCEGRRIDPPDLRGRRVGVRAYSQTTGLWARGVLSDTYGVPSREVTWVTTEGSHVAGVPEPANVERTSQNLVGALREGDLAAVVLGRPFAEKVGGIVPLIPDWETQQEKFFDRHGWVPANHLVVVKRDLLRSEPDLIRRVYHGLGTGRGVSPALLDMLGTAIRYAHEQQVIRRDLDAAELFADFETYVGQE